MNLPPMTDEEKRLEEEAFIHIKYKSKKLIEQYASDCAVVKKPVSLFMAGSPGAGKTEVSKNLMKRFETVPIRIDADEIRPWCPGYTGTNAHLFQKAATKGVHILYDHALSAGIHLILDGTFAYMKADENMRRSINHGRRTELWFVYQDLVKAWEFTKVRELAESRHVSKDVFVKSFFKAKENTRKVKTAFENSLTLNLLIKSIDGGEDLRLNIQADELDRYIPASYSEDELTNLLHD